MAVNFEDLDHARSTAQEIPNVRRYTECAVHVSSARYEASNFGSTTIRGYRTAESCSG